MNNAMAFRFANFYCRLLWKGVLLGIPGFFKLLNIAISMVFEPKQ